MTKKELFPETPKQWATEKVVDLLYLYIEGWFRDEYGCPPAWARGKGPVFNPPIRHQTQLCRTVLNLRNDLAHQIGADELDIEPRFHE